MEKALPVQGIKAVIKGWGDANDEMLKNKKSSGNRKTVKSSKGKKK